MVSFVLFFALENEHFLWFFKINSEILFSESFKFRSNTFLFFLYFLNGIHFLIDKNMGSLTGFFFKILKIENKYLVRIKYYIQLFDF